MKVRDLIRKKEATVHTTAPDTMLLDCIKSLNYHNIGALLVLNNDKLVGIISERDILHATEKYGSDLHNVSVKDIMTEDLFTCTPEDKVDKIMALMTNRRIRHLPVLEGGMLTGVISIGDVVKAQLKESEIEARDLKDYIHGRR